MEGLWNEIRTVRAGPTALRSFGLLVGAILLAITGVSLYRHDLAFGAVHWSLLAAGLSLVIAGATRPRVLAFVYKIWMALALILGFVMSHVILSLVFFLVITPIGLFFRLRGRDPLRRKMEPRQTSFWIPKTERDASVKRLEKYY